MKATTRYSILAGFLAVSTFYLAAMPPSINYQGRLTDTLGSPLNGTVQVEVRLYDAASDGNLLYEETIGPVTVSDGVCHFSFGASGTGASAGLTIQSAMTAGLHFLALVVDGTETDPRMQLLSVPFALNASRSADAEALEYIVAGLMRRLDAGGIPVEPDNMVTVTGGSLPGVSGLGPLNVATFLTGETEVTLEDWNRVVEWAVLEGYDFGGTADGCAATHPVHTVSWFDATKWCNAKTEFMNAVNGTGLQPAYTVGGEVYRSGEAVPDWNTGASGYRLPSEAEWEYAARGGISSLGYTYSGSDTINDVAWYYDNSSGAECGMSGSRGTWPVRQKAPNEAGLHDMSGNAWEWVWDAAYGGPSRRQRGGSWDRGAPYAQVDYRRFKDPDERADNYGFRIARNPPN